MAYPTQKIELPPKYYLEYFNYLVAFVTKKYDNILNENEKNFIQKYEALSENEKCLFIRFINRSGRFFRTEKLKYEEIGDLKPVINELVNQNFIEKANRNWLPLAVEFLQVFPKNELILMFKNAGITFKGHAGFSKNETVEKLLSLTKAEDLLIILEEYEPIIKVNFEVEVMMLKFLFLEIDTTP